MKFVEAFKALGYLPDNPQNERSAEADHGIRITTLRKERGVENGLPYFDLWGHFPDGSEWEKPSGHRKRTRHLVRAMKEFNGKVDVIFLSGTPGQSYDDASPWVPDERGGRYWHISRFEEKSGYFRAEITPEKLEEA